VNYIFKSKVENHQEIKKKLLQQINLIPQNPIVEKGQNIIHTDWNLPAMMHREYKDLFLKTVNNHLINMCHTLGVNHYYISNYWFQKYGQRGKHSWHTHPESNYSNVYFLECPRGSSTKFKNFTEDCEEGDILSFPAFLPHMSPPIENDDIKTVIAFNTSFDIIEQQ
jgi:hypothetical protein